MPLRLDLYAGHKLSVSSKGSEASSPGSGKKKWTSPIDTDVSLSDAERVGMSRYQLVEEPQQHRRIYTARCGFGDSPRQANYE